MNEAPKVLSKFGFPRMLLFSHVCKPTLKEPPNCGILDDHFLPDIEELDLSSNLLHSWSVSEASAFCVGEADLCPCR